MHFIVYTNFVHPAFSLVSAPTLRDTVRSYALENLVGLDADGSLVRESGARQPTKYSHELEVIECMEKVGYVNWTLRALKNGDWRKRIVHAFHGLEPAKIRKFAALCRNQFPDDVIDRKNVFVWELNSGFLVTFYRKERKKYTCDPIPPTAIGPRFLVPNIDPSRAHRWTGDYDDILADMKLH